MASLKPILGYWDIRGLGEPIRYLLKYVGVDFVDKRYKFGPSPDYSMKNWLDDKFNLDLDFPNLPYLIDGEIKITQSKAILRYLGRKYGLDGNTENEKVRIDVAEQETIDLRGVLRHVCLFEPDSKDDCFKNISPKFEQFTNFLGNRRWIAGNQISYADFFLYETLSFYCLVKSDCLDGFKVLADYVKRFEELPQIRGYLDSGSFHRLPIFKPQAFLCGKREH